MSRGILTTGPMEEEKEDEPSVPKPLYDGYFVILAQNTEERNVLVSIVRDFGGIVVSEEDIPLLVNIVVTDWLNDMPLECLEGNHGTYEPAVLHDMKEFYDEHGFAGPFCNANESPAIDFCWEPYYIHEDIVTAEAVPRNIMQEVSPHPKYQRQSCY